MNALLDLLLTITGLRVIREAAVVGLLALGVLGTTAVITTAWLSRRKRSMLR